MLLVLLVLFVVFLFRILSFRPSSSLVLFLVIRGLLFSLWLFLVLLLCGRTLFLVLLTGILCSFLLVLLLLFLVLLFLVFSLILLVLLGLFFCLRQLIVFVFSFFW